MWYQKYLPRISKKNIYIYYSGQKHYTAVLCLPLIQDQVYGVTIPRTLRHLSLTLSGRFQSIPKPEAINRGSVIPHFNCTLAT